MDKLSEWLALPVTAVQEGKGSSRQKCTQERRGKDEHCQANSQMLEGRLGLFPLMGTEMWVRRKGDPDPLIFIRRDKGC